METSTTTPLPADGIAAPPTQAEPVTNTVLYALSVLCEDGQTVEIRAKGRDGSVLSGYGQDLDELARQVDILDTTDTGAIYCTLNPVNSALMARRSRVGKTRNTDPLTSDTDIVRRRWLPVDLDPVRPAGVSATDAEKDAARKKAGLVIAYLTGMGWPAPVVADSGNGYHVLYRVDLPNDEPARDLVKGCLEALAARFSDNGVSVDVKNFNAARIWKIYGTTARKGEDTQDRPHRRARIMSAPDPVVVVDREHLEALAAEVKQAPTPAPARKKGKGQDFDLAEWLAEYEPNLPCKVIPKNKAGHRYFYALDPCPFSNGAHSDGAYLGQYANGAVFAKCHHNSCGNENRWKELRAMGDQGYTFSARTTGSKNHQGEDVLESKEDDTARILPFFEKDGHLYLDVIEHGGVFGFACEHDGEIRFHATVFDNGDAIKPAVLPVHHDTRETVFVVGVPRADLVQTAPLLSPDELYTRLAEHIKKYCDMPDRDRELAVYFALYTWFYDKCATSPYLRFLGDTGKGKSRLTEVISDLCFYPIKATGSSTTSGLMRFHERWRGTLVIDEGDLRGGADDPLVKFLNIGFERGKFIILSDTNDPNRQLIFHPYGPKVLAMREPFRDNATEGRCLSYSPYETHRKDIPPELSPIYHAEVAELRAIIARFVLHQWQVVDGTKMMDYGDLDIERRLLQMARPISVVLQLFPDGNVRFVEYLKYRQQEIKRTRSESWEGSLFNYAYSLAVGDETVDGVIPEAVTGRDIGEVFKAKTGRVNDALRSIGFGIESDNIQITRKDGTIVRKTVRKLVVPSPQVWQEITRRYWFRDDDTRSPSCPDALKGKKWVDPQQPLIKPIPPADTSDAAQTGGVTSVTTVTPAGGGGSISQPSNITEKASTENTRAAPPSVTLVTLVTDAATFEELIARYDLPPGPDISQHVKFTKAGSACLCKGCTSPAAWHGTDSVRPLPLCDHHYQELNTARSGGAQP